ncbi:MAG: hypothetical protein KatS3mg016_1440 [Fimbriimonadales bacterium]|nr:MAG: hypothetical protein KatS3mg016_1440 [Fimbriimonadales bacterium]
MRVLIQQPRLPHYRVPLMNRLVEAHGWELTVAFTPRSGQGESGLEVRKSDLFECVALPLRQFRAGSLKLNVQRGLLRLLRAGRWDAFFWEGVHANLSGYLAARWCRRRQIPNICWLKGYFEPATLPRHLMNQWLWRVPDAFVPYGDETHSFLLRYGVRPEQIVRAYNTVDVEGIAARREQLRARGLSLLESIGWRQARPLLACVGRLTPQKRPQDAIQAVYHLRQHGERVFLLMVGDGSERSTLEQLVQTLGISDSVYITGRVPEDDDSAVLAAADLALFPGAHGLAINQAMALGTPVVVADLPGPDGEMVIQERTGWRYPVGDIQALAHAVTTVLHSPKRPVVITQAHEEMLQRRSLAQYAKAFTEAVALARKRRGR